MPADPFSDKTTLKKLTRSWKVAVKTKQGHVPKQKKIIGSRTWYYPFVTLFCVSIFVSFSLKVAGLKLSPEAHFSGLVIILTIYGFLFLGSLHTCFNTQIPMPLLNTPVQAKLLFQLRRRTAYKAAFIAIGVFLFIANISAEDSISMLIPSLTGALLFLISTATACLLALKFNPFKLFLIACITSLLLLIFLASSSLHESAYIYLVTTLQYTPVGLALGSIRQQGLQLPIWSLTLLAISSLTIIQHYLKHLFIHFKIDRSSEEEFENLAFQEQIEELEDLVTSEKVNTVVDHAQITEALRLHIEPQEYKSEKLLERTYRGLHTVRERTLLDLATPASLTKPFKLSILFLLGAVTLLVFNHYSKWQAPDFLIYFSILASLFNTMLNSSPQTLLFENTYTTFKRPLLAYLPATYSEVIRLHLKEITFSALWKIPMLFLILTVFRHTRDQTTLQPFPYLLVITFYFAFSYLKIFRYRQSHNLISRWIGYKAFNILSLLLTIVVFLCVVFAGTSIIEDFHSSYIYGISISLIILCALLALFHRMSYRSMRLDVIEKTAVQE